MEAQRYSKSLVLSSHSQTLMSACLHILLGTLLIVVIGVTMISCTGNSDHSKKAHDWVGHHRDELTALRGQPSHEAPLAHGGRSLVYQRQGGPVNQRRARCRTVFITDAKGIIQSAGEYPC
jgi:hypothetical protein